MPLLVVCNGHGTDRIVKAAVSKPTVFVVDDDPSVRESLQPLLELEGWDILTFDSALAFLAHQSTNYPCCLVLDVGLPDLSGLDLQSLLAKERKEMPIIFITGQGDVPTSVRAMKAGAAEFLMKPFAPDVLVEGIRQALERSRSAVTLSAEIDALRSRYSTLTVREREVMALVIEGLLNKQIAHQLRLSEVTVKVHRGRAMRKMNAGSLAALVRMASHLGDDPLPAVPHPPTGA